MKDDQATGLCGGIDVPSGVKPPRAASFAKFGSRPCAIRSRGQVEVEAVEPEHDDAAPEGPVMRGRTPTSRAAATALRHDGHEREPPLAHARPASGRPSM